MKLSECKINKDCEIINLNIDDEKLKLHLAEIGFYPTNIISILKYSIFKKTLLVKVLDSCFAIKINIAKLVEVEYV